MADDTRIADACLLLNYSHQSQKEQVHQDNSMKCHSMVPELECTQKELNTTCSTTSSSNCSYVTSHNQNYFSFIGSSEIDTIVTNQPKILYQPISGASQLRPGCVRESLDDLIAAVNCSLRSLESHSVGIKRVNNSDNLAIRKTSPPSHLRDHDYSLRLDDNPLILQKLVADNLDASRVEALQIASHIQNTPTELKSKISSRKKSIGKELDFKPESDEIMKKAPLKLVAVHLGVGKCHNEADSSQIAKSICEEVMFNINNVSLTQNNKLTARSIETKCDVPADLAVVQLIKLMEDHQALNCGYGSNLNLRGEVECDASLMSDKTQLWAGVGAISGCKNPIMLAKTLYDHHWIDRPLNLIQPNLLVGSGAKQWMREHCPHLSVMDSKMISSQSFSKYQKLKSRYDAEVKLKKLQEEQSRRNVLPDTSNGASEESKHGFYCTATGRNLRKSFSFAARSPALEQVDSQVAIDLPLSLEREENKFGCDRLDTVGAIAVDEENNFTSAISSGGLLLKLRGRLGQAAVPGAGCWAQDSVAVTTTGLGEYLTLNLFAKKFHEKIITLRLLYDLGHVEKKQDLSELITCGIQECFEDLANSPSFSNNLPQYRLAGMLSVCTLNSRQSPKRVDSNDLYLSYAHNTGSMCIGYMSSDDNVANSLISRREQGESENKAIIKTMKFSFNQSKDSINIETVGAFDHSIESRDQAD